jgi:hypothetical protein
MLGASLLARVGRHTRDREALELAKASVMYTCLRQNTDGSWFYGEEQKYRWIDNFHTGYNLDSLKRYVDCTGDYAYLGVLNRGFEYFVEHFFESSGCPKYYSDNANPIDIQCAAQAIDTLAYFSDTNPEVLTLARKVAQWTITNMQAADGHFNYRNLGWKTVKTPMFHWGQATMFNALANLLTKWRATVSPRNADATACSRAAI